MMAVIHQPQRLKSVRLLQYFMEKASHVITNCKVWLSIAFFYYKNNMTKKSDGTSQKIQHCKIDLS